MTPGDQERFADLVKRFVDDSDFEPPFFLIVTGQNKTISVDWHTGSGVERLCANGVERGFVAPLVVAIVALDGRGTACTITVENAPPTIQ
jgi:hypothetical protein